MVREMTRPDNARVAIPSVSGTPKATVNQSQGPPLSKGTTSRWTATHTAHEPIASQSYRVRLSLSDGSDPVAYELSAGESDMAQLYT